MELVRALAEPIAARLGYSLWDVRFVKEGAEWYLRIFIDKPEGIGIDDCVAMSRAVNDPLDELDPIEQAYCLEVCSPGMNRELNGILLGYENGEMTIDTGEEHPLHLARTAVSRVRLADDDISGGIEES